MLAAFMASRPRRLCAKYQVSQRVETVCSQCRLPMARAGLVEAGHLGLGRQIADERIASQLWLHGGAT